MNHLPGSLKPLPGTWLRAIAARLCGPRAMERLIDPAIADLQREYADAGRAGRTWGRHRARLAGYVAFLQVLAWHASRSLLRSLRVHVTGQDDGVGRRTLKIFAVSFAIVLMLMELPPLLSVPASTRASYVTLALLLMAQALPLALPVAVLIGLLSGAGGRIVSRASCAAVLLLALAGSIASYGTLNWITPASNQAFRVAVSGQQVPRGANELTLRELRERLHEVVAGHAVPWPFDAEMVPFLQFQYHARHAISCATFLFALFGLAVLHRAPAERLRLGTMVAVVYVGYYVALSPGRGWWIDADMSPAALAWLPNFLIAAAALISFSAAPRLGSAAEAEAEVRR